MMNKLTKRFTRGRKTGNKRKAANTPEIDTTGVPEIDVPATPFEEGDDAPTPLNLNNYSLVEDTEKHASQSISYTEQKLKYTHRGSLFTLISVYNDVRKYAPGVAYLIDKSGWGRLLSMRIGETTHALVDYLVERWWDSTHTFHFKFGEMGITPLDWSMLTGLRIDDVSRPIPYDSTKYNFLYVRNNIFPELLDSAQAARNGVPVQWTSDALTVAFLGKYLTKDNLQASTDNFQLFEKLARAFFMFALGSFFFSNAKNYIDAGWLAAFEDFDQISSFDWGGVGLANLYMSLNLASRGQKALNGPFQILEFWGYEYLGICRPTVPDESTINDWPRCSRWKTKKKTNTIFLPRTLLDGLTADDVTWTPWEAATALLESQELRPAVELSRKRVVFNLGLDTTIWYLGDRCKRQNSHDFGIPRNPPEHLYGMMSIEEADNLREAGWVDADVFVQIAPYEVYLHYWQHVTNFGTFTATIDWEVDVYGTSGDTYKLTIDRPDEHVQIPPQEQLSLPQAYTMIQDYADLTSAFQTCILNETRDRMYMLMTKDDTIARLTKEISDLHGQVTHLQGRLLNSSNPSLGFGSFTGTVPLQIWDQLQPPTNPSTSSASTSTNTPFQQPRRQS